MKWLGAGLLSLMVIGFATPAAAQDTPKAEVSVGYNWFAAKQSGDGFEDSDWEKFPKGWYADVAGNVSDTLSIVGQVTGNYKSFEDDSDLNVHSFMAGIRGSSPGRVRGFGQVLLGGVKAKVSDPLFGDFDETDFALQLGGGVNVLGSGNVGLRLGVDYLRVMASDEGDVLAGGDLNGFRFNVGVTFGIGSR
jgi:hypothetical protein